MNKEEKAAWEAIRQADAGEKVTAFCCVRCAMAYLDSLSIKRARQDE